MSETVPARILVLVSGDGSNLQALIDGEKRGALRGGKITAVISDRPHVYALERAKEAGIPGFTEIPDRNLPREERLRELSDRILRRCEEYRIGLIVYAGFLSILAGELIGAYAGRMINIHPSLLPKFGGRGMYGEKIHQAVLDAGETESGCTVHLVDSGTDTGPILLQRKVPVLPEDTPASLAARIRPEEHAALVMAAALMLDRES